MKKILITTTLASVYLIIAISIYAQTNVDFNNKGSEITINPVDPVCANENVFKLIVNTPGGNWSGNGIVDEKEGMFDPSEANTGENLILYQLIMDEDTITAEIYIVVHEMPEINVTRTPYTGCAPLSVTFDNNTTNTDYTYYWEFYDASSEVVNWSGLKQNSFTYNEVGTFKVNLTVTTADGCRDSVTLFTNVHEKPKADFNAFPWKVGLFEANISFEDMSTGAAVWEWNFGDGNISSEQHPKHIYYEPGEFPVQLTILNQYLCTDTITKTVTIVEDHKVYFPNAINLTSFENDKFFPKGVGIDKDHYQLSIYSRFGDLIFYTTNFETAWEGKFRNNKGDYVPQGKYTYVATIRDLRGQFHTYAGFISVFR